MKKTLLIITLIACTFIAWGQGKPGRGELKALFFEVQCEEIMDGLDLNEEKRTAFKAIYTRYTDALSAIGFHTPNLNLKNLQKQSDEQIEKRILATYEKTRQAMAIKEQYYYEFKTILTPQEIVQMYLIEKSVRDKLLAELRNRNAARE